MTYVWPEVRQTTAEDLAKGAQLVAAAAGGDDEASRRAAASLLGAAVGEIDAVRAVPAGVEIKSGGLFYLWVPPERPDGVGQTGLLLLQAPAYGRPLAMPVYRPPLDVDGLCQVTVAAPLTVADLDDEIGRLRVHQERVARALVEYPVTADQGERLTEAAGRLGHELAALERRRPVLADQARRYAEAREAARQGSEHIQLDALYRQADEMFAAFMAGYRRLETARMAAVAAGAPESWGIPDWQSITPATRRRYVRGFEQADVLARWVTDHWPAIMSAVPPELAAVPSGSPQQSKSRRRSKLRKLK